MCNGEFYPRDVFDSDSEFSSSGDEQDTVFDRYGPFLEHGSGLGGAGVDDEDSTDDSGMELMASVARDLALTDSSEDSAGVEEFEYGGSGSGYSARDDGLEFTGDHNNVHSDVEVYRGVPDQHDGEARPAFGFFRGFTRIFLVLMQRSARAFSQDDAGALAI